MTKVRSTKKSLAFSILSLVLCFSMLLGTTFAWFTDSVTSANNIIQSGKLDVGMYWADGTKAVPTEDEDWTDASIGAIFDYDLWEPGYVQVRHIKIANEGTLALKYMVNIVANGEVSDLADVIDVYYVDPAVQVADRTALTEDKKIGTLTEVLEALGITGNGTLAAGAVDTITIALKMQESAGNTYQEKSIGSSFSIQLLATQLTAELDSFDDQYDKDATYPTVNTVTVPEDNTADVLLMTENIKVTVPAEDANDGDIYEIVVSNEETKTDAATDETTVAFDLTMYKNNVKVDGETVYAITKEVGTGLFISEVTHNGNALTKADTGADQTYNYNSTTGVLTIYTKSFSPFAFSYFEGVDMVAHKAGAKTFALTFDELRALVNAGQDFSGWTVTLMKDIDFAGEEITPIGIATGAGTSLEGCAPFSGMFDGNGHTLSNYTVKSGVTVDGDPWLSLFALIYAKDGNTAGVKNLTIKNASYDNPNATVGIIANLANSDGASALEFSNLDIHGTVNAFGYYGEAGLVTLMYGSEALVSNVDLDVDFIIPVDFSVAGYKFISPCFGQLSMLENGHITIENVDYSECDFYYPSTFKLEDRSTVIAGYNSIWVYNTLAGTRVLGSGGYSGQFYNRGISITIDGTTYTHADLLKGQKDNPGYMYDYIIRPDSYTAYTPVTTAEELKAAIQNAEDDDVILLANDITVTDTWDARYGGTTNNNVTIHGAGHTLKFTGEVLDGNNKNSVFIFNGDATVKALTFDMSDVVKNKALRMRAICAAGNLLVDGCTFIGNAAYTSDEAICVGEAHTELQTPVTATIMNSTFDGAWRRAISDNESGKKEIKSYVMTGNNIASMVNVSAYESISFTGNVVADGTRIILTSYTNKGGVQITKD